MPVLPGMQNTFVALVKCSVVLVYFRGSNRLLAQMRRCRRPEAVSLQPPIDKPVALDVIGGNTLHVVR